jgi:glycosyltransferase involved in cell wall biosynthesis
MKEQVVIFIDFRGIISADNNHETLSRHVGYSKILKEMTSENSRIIVAAFGEVSKSVKKNEDIELVEICKKKFPNLKTFRNMRRMLTEHKSSPITIIAGDPWETYWVSLICKLLFSRSAKLQVQIHADVGSDLWIKQSLSNRMRSHLIFVGNRHVNTIRFVSKGQYYKFKERYGTGFARNVIVPVPLNITSVIEDLPETGRSDILFVGRLHKDRGLEVFCKIVSNINAYTGEFNVNVVGTGPEEQAFLKSLERICGRERVNMFGFSNNFKIQEIAKSCRMLLSTAASESYGRAMREAIFYGLPVWSVANEGALELQKEFGPTIVRIVNPAEPAHLHFGDYAEIGTARVSKHVREQINLSDSVKIRTLVESWL